MLNSHLPQDAHTALLIGRLWVPEAGAHVVAVTPQDVFDLSELASTSSALLELPDVATRVQDFVNSGLAPVLCSTDQALDNSLQAQHKPDAPWFMAPCDLQAVKAAGVTFVASMLERVIEEQARGDANAFWNIVVLVTLSVRRHPISLCKYNNKPWGSCEVGF